MIEIGISPDEFQDFMKKTKLAMANWQKKKNAATKDAWNFKKQQMNNKLAKQLTMANMTEVAKQMFPVMSFIPTKCLSICDAQQAANKKDSITPISDSIKNNVESTKLLVTDVVSSFTDSIGQAFAGVGSFFSTAVDRCKKFSKYIYIISIMPT